MTFNPNTFFLLILCFLTACDSREILTELDLQSEAPKIVLHATLLNDDYASVSVDRTIPVNSDSVILNKGIKNAAVSLWENDNLFATLNLKSDSIWSSNVNPLTGMSTPFLSRIIYHYDSPEKLHLQAGAYYHLSATAEGYPDVESEKVMYKEETTILGYTVGGSERDSIFGSLVFSEVSLHLKNTSQGMEHINVVFYPWRHDIDDLFFFGGKLEGSDGTAYDFDGSIENEIFIKKHTVTVLDFFASNTTDCINECIFPPEGSRVIVQTFSPELVEYRKFLLSNYDEFIGGFFPRNPYVVTNINGGYGFFSIMEQDTIIIEE